MNLQTDRIGIGIGFEEEDEEGSERLRVRKRNGEADIYNTYQNYNHNHSFTKTDTYPAHILDNIPLSNPIELQQENNRDAIGARLHLIGENVRPSYDNLALRSASLGQNVQLLFRAPQLSDCGFEKVGVQEDARLMPTCFERHQLPEDIEEVDNKSDIICCFGDKALDDQLSADEENRQMGLIDRKEIRSAYLMAQLDLLANEYLDEDDKLNLCYYLNEFETNSCDLSGLLANLLQNLLIKLPNPMIKYKLLNYIKQLYIESGEQREEKGYLLGRRDSYESKHSNGLINGQTTKQTTNSNDCKHQLDLRLFEAMISRYLVASNVLMYDKRLEHSRDLIGDRDGDEEDGQSRLASQIIDARAPLFTSTTLNWSPSFDHLNGLRNLSGLRDDSMMNLLDYEQRLLWLRDVSSCCWGIDGSECLREPLFEQYRQTNSTRLNQRQNSGSSLESGKEEQRALAGERQTRGSLLSLLEQPGATDTGSFAKSLMDNQFKQNFINSSGQHHHYQLYQEEKEEEAKANNLNSITSNIHRESAYAHVIPNQQLWPNNGLSVSSINNDLSRNFEAQFKAIKLSGDETPLSSISDSLESVLHDRDRDRLEASNSLSLLNIVSAQSNAITHFRPNAARRAKSERDLRHPNNTRTFFQEHQSGFKFEYPPEESLMDDDDDDNRQPQAHRTLNGSCRFPQADHYRTANYRTADSHQLSSQVSKDCINNGLNKGAQMVCQRASGGSIQDLALRSRARARGSSEPRFHGRVVSSSADRWTRPRIVGSICGQTICKQRCCSSMSVPCDAPNLSALTYMRGGPSLSNNRPLNPYPHPAQQQQHGHWNHHETQRALSWQCNRARQRHRPATILNPTVPRAIGSHFAPATSSLASSPIAHDKLAPQLATTNCSWQCDEQASYYLQKAPQKQQTRPKVSSSLGSSWQSNLGASSHRNRRHRRHHNQQQQQPSKLHLRSSQLKDNSRNQMEEEEAAEDDDGDDDDELSDEVSLSIVPNQAKAILPNSVAEQMREQASNFVSQYKGTKQRVKSGQSNGQATNLQVRRTLRVKIKKSKPILGIAIEGGFNVSGQLLPRIVCVHEDGAAYQCGKLRASDLIIEVNGKSTVNMTHDEIAETIATAYYQDPRSHIEFLIGESIHV